MIYFANPSTQRVRDAMTAGLLGEIITPEQGNLLLPGVTFCIDNGVYGGTYPGNDEYLRYIARFAADAARCAFVTAPDVVGQAKPTLVRSAPLLGPIADLGFRPALVAQNGLTPDMVPWARIGALFLGGSAECVPCEYVRPHGDTDTTACPACARDLTEWKTGFAARLLARVAGELGVWLHMGRVNSGLRHDAARGMGCDSDDGTILAMFPDRRLPEVLGWQRRASDQGMLWEES